MDLNLNFEYYPQLSTDKLLEAKQLILKNKHNWDEPFFINTSDFVDLKHIEKICEGYRNNENIRNLIILGTGGSIQTLLCLSHLTEKKIFPITSSRPSEINNCLKFCNENNSLVIPISRGGKTLDIISTLELFLQKNFPFLGISSRGPMNEILKEIGCSILDVPDLSGRFAASITNVALAPAYIAGIDIKAFLKYLDYGYSHFMDLENIANNSNNRNYALELATFLYNLYLKGYRNIFSMPYFKDLEYITGLFLQGLSESSGKDGKGLIGTYQSAPLCQHSILEFLLGGSSSSVSPILWTTDEEKHDYSLSSKIDFINGKSAEEIINFQADATFQALIEKEVPSTKISSKDVYLKSIAELISLIQASIYYFCTMINVNWATNPSVIIGKEICNNALKMNKSKDERVQDRKNIANDKFQNFF